MLSRVLLKLRDIWWCCNNDVMLSNPSCICVWRWPSSPGWNFGGGALIFTKERSLKIFTSHSFELLSNFHFVRKRKFHQNKLWRKIHKTCWVAPKSWGNLGNLEIVLNHARRSLTFKCSATMMMHVMMIKRILVWVGLPPPIPPTIVCDVLITIIV